MEQKKNVEKAEQKNQLLKVKQEKEKSKKEVSLSKNINEEEVKQKKKLTSRFKRLEEELSNTKKEKEKFEKDLSDQSVYSNPEKFKNALENFNKHEDKLKEITKEWEDVFVKLSGME